MHNNEPVNKKFGNSNEAEELDLRPILDSVKSFFAGISTLVEFMIYSTKKMLLFISVFTLIGLSIGIVKYFKDRPVYLTTMTLTSNLLTNEYCKNLIYDLQSIKEDNNNELLANKLNINVEAANAIKRLSYEGFLKEDKLDTIPIGTPFTIEMEYYNNDIVESVEAGLVNYLENNKYAKVRKKAKRDRLQMMSNIILEEIASLDSLKEVMAAGLAPRGTSNGFVYGQPLDPVNVYREAMQLHKERLKIDSEIKLIDNVEVINNFNKKRTPVSPNFILNILSGILLGYSFGLIVAMIKKKNEFNNQKNSKASRIVA
jgi:hypothetical protein